MAMVLPDMVVVDDVERKKVLAWRTSSVKGHMGCRVNWATG
jgi:hypothetical protein